MSPDWLLLCFVVYSYLWVTRYRNRPSKQTNERTSMRILQQIKRESRATEMWSDENRAFIRLENALNTPSFYSAFLRFSRPAKITGVWMNIWTDQYKMRRRALGLRCPLQCRCIHAQCLWMDNDKTLYRKTLSTQPVPPSSEKRNDNQLFPTPTHLNLPHFSILILFQFSLSALCCYS